MNIRIASILFFALTVLVQSGGAQDDVEAGRSLFKANCTACHHLEMRLVGPALTGVNDRHDQEWLIKFIQSSQSVIESGDTTAINLFNQYNKVPMPDQDLTEEQILNVLAYIEEGAAPRDSGEITRPAEAATPNIEPLKFSDYRFWILYTITVILVIVVVYYRAEIAALSKASEDGPE